MKLQVWTEEVGAELVWMGGIDVELLVQTEGAQDGLY